MLGYHSIKKQDCPKVAFLALYGIISWLFSFKKREIGGAQQALTTRFRQSRLTIISKISETERKKINIKHDIS
jgi:hypothetical protein